MNTENHYQETDLGNIAPNPRGEYSESETYEYLDYVYYQGGSYLCLAELGATITGIAPEPGKTTEYWQAVALPGKQGEPGTPGENGITPHIGDNGNWYIGETDTGIRGQGRDGANGVTPHIGANGNWYLGETDTGVKAQGADGTTPHIGSNRHWWIGNSDTGVIASGTDGNDGEPGTTPHIGENNHWWIGDVDTGVDARGTKGNDGTTPHVGANNHWYIGETDTGVVAQGADGYTPQKDIDYTDGADGKSAYEYAQEGGYTGTEEEFAAKLAAEYPTDVQINGTSIVGEDGVANIPLAGTASPGAVKFRVNGGIVGIGTEKGIYLDNTITLLPLRNPNVVVLGSNYDHAIKYAMTDGKGPKWTDTEKTGAWKRLTSIKTAMDEVAVAGAHYYLGELTELSIILPDDALTGQEITVVWYNGETPATLAISGNMLDSDYVPGANSQSEISALWDGTYWSLISNEQSVPVTETTEEVTTNET